MPTKLYFYLFVLVFLAVLAILWPKEGVPEPEPKIKNFEDCAKAGYPIMESYPRQCQAPGAGNFVEEIILEK